MRPPLRTFTSIALAVSSTVVALALTVLPASAHATASSNGGAVAASGGRTTITVSIDHGCSTNPTTGMRIELPKGATQVTATDSTGFASSVSATEVAWKGGTIPATQGASFTFTAYLQQNAGETVTLPTIQQCAGGSEIAWIGAPTADTSENARPAPTFVVPINASRTSTTLTAPSTTAAMAIDASAITRSGSETHGEGAVVGGVAFGVIVIGALMLWLKYRKRSPQS